MDIREKLKYYYGQSQDGQNTDKRPLNYLEKICGGQIIEADSLPVLKIENAVHASQIEINSHDLIPQCVSIPLLTKNQFPDQIALQDILVFDLETTGLAGGTGTYPFLIGLGFFQEQHVIIVQYLLPDFGREIAAYFDMLPLLKKKSILLSYNGKSFDYPLIRNRFILNRMQNPFEHYSHLDLLHPARRIWKDIFPSCSLDMIEERIFRFNRWRDIEGYLIPQAYFNFISSGEVSEIQRIINHNQQDILSLARLILYMHHLENQPIPEFHHSDHLLALVDLAIQSGDLEQVKTVIHKFGFEQENIPASLLRNYSLILKRAGFWSQALDIWNRLINRNEQILFACEEMAKYYEHREKSISQALEFTNRAILYIDQLQAIGRIQVDDSPRNRFSHRLQRLMSKFS